MSIGGPHEVLPPHDPAYRRAIRWIIGRKAWHRTTQYLNNYMNRPGNVGGSSP